MRGLHVFLAVRDSPKIETRKTPYFFNSAVSRAVKIMGCCFGRGGGRRVPTFGDSIDNIDGCKSLSVCGVVQSTFGDLFNNCYAITMLC